MPILYNPMPQFLDATGVVLSGGTLNFYVAGTTTTKNVYTDDTYGTSLGSTITLNSAGYPTSDGGTTVCTIYLNGAYKIVLKDSTGTTLRTVDNVTSIWQVLGVLNKSANYTVTLTDNNKFVYCDASSGIMTISLPAAASAGAGFVIEIKKIDTSTYTVIVDPNASEQIDGLTSLSLYYKNEGIRAICTGTAWYTNDRLRAFYDDNSKLLIAPITNSSPVNYLAVANSATGIAPALTSAGTDTNVDISITGQGTGKVVLGQATTAGVQLIYNQPLLDINGSNLITFANAASAINSIKVTNAATGAGPSITSYSTGSDTNIDLNLLCLGTGKVKLKSSNATAAAIELTSSKVTLLSDQPVADSAGNSYITFTKAATAVNNLNIANSATGAGVVLSSVGTDTDINLDLQAKGAGVYKFKSTATQAAKVNYYASNSTTNAVTLTTAATAARTFTLPDSDISQCIVQEVFTSTATMSTGTTVVPLDDTIPQSTEGDQYLSQAITPKNTNNWLTINVSLQVAASVAANIIVALFQDSTASALCATTLYQATAGKQSTVTLTHRMQAGTVSATTFKIRAGVSTAGTMTLNGAAGARLFGGVTLSSMRITEVTP